MKKRNIIVCCISILIVIEFIAIMVFGSKENTFTKNGVTYALTVDGVKQNSFPSKGMYRVDTECVNATCKWDYEAWNLYIENIIGDVSCDISFTTIAKSYLNQKIMSLEGTHQGIGDLVHETFNAPDFTNSTNLTQSEYGTISQYSSSSYSSTSGVAVTNAFSYSNNEWVSNPENLTTNTYYHINFNLSAEAYYKVCYEISTGNNNNTLHMYKGTTAITLNGYNNASSYEIVTGCVDLGYISEPTNFRITQRAYVDIATIKFYVQKSNVSKMRDTGYRYEGQDPNNYVWFNNELWRIIGVMNSDSHGIKEQNLVKILKTNSIGGIVWGIGTIGNNNWVESPLNSLLNTEYLNSVNGTNGTNCYSYSNSTKGNCDYRNIGIKTEYKDMIKEVTWYLGGTKSSSVTSNQMYEFERRGETGNSNSNPNKTTGKIGLMYASDYGFAVLDNICSRSTILESKLSSNDSNCTVNNWIYLGGREWTITPNTNSSSASFCLQSGYGLTSGSTYNGYSVRPTLYLNENVYVLDGDGSYNDPYIIAMD